MAHDPPWSNVARAPEERHDAATSQAVRLAQVSFQSSVTSALSTLETGQPALAPSAIFWNCSRPMLGTLASSVSADLEILKPAPSDSMVTAAEAAMRVGVKPALERANASAMVKQPACAAAISSSGLVPLVSPKRVLKP